MTESTAVVPQKDQTVDQYCFFFDIDGTLAELQATPEKVFIPKSIIEQLQRLQQHTQGALALVSGRPLSQIAQLVGPLECPAAGVHGAEWRLNDGEIHSITVSTDELATIEKKLVKVTGSFSGVLLEVKPLAFALHYRQAPTARCQLEQLAQQIVTEFPSFKLQPGKCVVEIKPAAVDKGKAISEFLKQPPFAGRTPVMVGDDLTDESAFATVNQLAGVSIKVGEGESVARYRLADVEQVHDWIQRLLDGPIYKHLKRSS